MLEIKITCYCCLTYKHDIKLMYPIVKSKKLFFLQSKRSAWTTAFIGNIITVPLAIILKNQRYISPNAISIMGCVVFFVSAIFYLFNPNYSLFCSVGFFSSFLLDSTDGKLARIRGEGSKFGALLDAKLDLLVHSIGLLIVGLAISKHINNVIPVIIMLPYIFYLTNSHLKGIRIILKKGKLFSHKYPIPKNKWDKFCFKHGLSQFPYDDWEVTYICILIVSINLQDPILFLFISVYINLFIKVYRHLKNKYLKNK